MIGSPQAKTKTSRPERKVGAEARPLQKQRLPLDTRARVQNVGGAEVTPGIEDPVITTAENQVGTDDLGAEVLGANTDTVAEIGDMGAETDMEAETDMGVETDIEAETDMGAETDRIPEIDTKSIPGNSGKSSEERARFT